MRNIKSSLDRELFLDNLADYEEAMPMVKDYRKQGLNTEIENQVMPFFYKSFENLLEFIDASDERERAIVEFIQTAGYGNDEDGFRTFIAAVDDPRKCAEWIVESLLTIDAQDIAQGAFLANALQVERKANVLRSFGQTHGLTRLANKIEGGGSLEPMV